MANSTTHSALDIPIRGALYNVPLVWLDADGDPTLPTGLDTEISKDNGTFANTTNAPTLAKEVGGVTDSAYGYVTLTAAEMTADIVILQAKDATQKATPVCLRLKRLPIVVEGTATAGAATTITLAVGSSAVDDFYNGAIIFTDGGTGPGQARRILDYVGSTRVATVATWETNPDVTTTYDILATAEWNTALNTRTMLALPAVAPNASGGLPTFGTGTGQLNVAGGRADADLKYLFGATLTEAAGAGKLAGALSKFLDVVTPLLDCSAAMRGTDSAALASVWTSARGTLVDQLDGAVDGTAVEIIKTVLTELSNRTNNPSLHDLLGIPDTAAHTLLTDIAAGNVTNVTGSVSGSVGSVTGAVGSVTGAVGSVSGAVGSVAGNVAGNVTGSIGSLNTQAKADVQAEAEEALRTYDLDHLIETTAGVEEPTDGTYLDQIMHKDATQTFDATTDSLEGAVDTGPTLTNQTTILSRLGDFAGTGLNSIKGFFQALFRDDAGVTGVNAPSEINEVENTVAGAYDGLTDSQEAQVDTGVNMKAISGDSTAADNLETMLDGTGGQKLTLEQLRIDSSTAGGGIDIDNSAGPAIDATGTTHGISASGSNSAGIGMRLAGGTTGQGLLVFAGLTSPTAGAGISANGAGAAPGIEGKGGATGNGMQLRGGATSGDGLNAAATTAGDGIEAAGAGGGYDVNADIVGTISTVTDVTNGVTLADDAITAAKIAPDAIGSSELAASAVTEIVAGLLAGDWASAEAGAESSTTVAGALALIRAAVAGRIAISGTTLTVYEADGTTVIATYTIASDYSTRSAPS